MVWTRADEAPMDKVVVVSDEQVSAAQALVRISGGIDKVDPLIAKIAQAQHATAEQKRQAARCRAARRRGKSVVPRCDDR